MAIDPTLGFPGTDIVVRIQRYIGNYENVFKSYIENSLPLAEFRYCKLHDWNFLQKQDLELAITNGQNKYDLTVANIGHYMSSTNVESIYNEEAGVYLKKVELNQIRRFDKKADDGNDDTDATHWAQAGENSIILYPATFKNATLKIDGKVSPPALTTLSNFPTVPFKYQEGFIKLVEAMALDREDDDRALPALRTAFELIKQDIQDDMRQLADTENPRFKSLREAASDGDASDFDKFRFWFYNDY